MPTHARRISMLFATASAMALSTIGPTNWATAAPDTTRQPHAAQQRDGDCAYQRARYHNVKIRTGPAARYPAIDILEKDHRLKAVTDDGECRYKDNPKGRYTACGAHNDQRWAQVYYAGKVRYIADACVDPEGGRTTGGSQRPNQNAHGTCYWKTTRDGVKLRPAPKTDAPVATALKKGSRLPAVSGDGGACGTARGGTYPGCDGRSRDNRWAKVVHEGKVHYLAAACAVPSWS